MSPHVYDQLDLATAAHAVDGSLGVREIDGGQALQVYAAGGASVLTVYQATELSESGEVTRLLPDPPTVGLPVFWIDAVAPLGDEGEVGVSIALRLALGLEAACIVEDE